MTGKIWDTHKRAFQDLKRTIIHVSILTSTYFDKKSTTFKFGCFYPNMVRENLSHPSTCVSGPETHVSACCRSSPTLFWFKNQLIKYLISNQIWWGKTWDMHKRALKGLKRTLMHILGFPYHILIKKTIFFSNQKYHRRRPEICINVRFRAWNARFCMSQVFPHHILILKNQTLYKLFFF